MRGAPNHGTEFFLHPGNGRGRGIKRSYKKTDGFDANSHVRLFRGIQCSLWIHASYVPSFIQTISLIKASFQSFEIEIGFV